MTHAYHQGLPGYDPEQMLHSSCSECVERAARPDHGIAHLDVDGFRRAWRRAARWQREGIDNLSPAERPMLAVLWVVQVHLERQGWPIGEVPGTFLGQKDLTDPEIPGLDVIAVGDTVDYRPHDGDIDTARGTVTRVWTNGKYVTIRPDDGTPVFVRHLRNVTRAPLCELWVTDGYHGRKCGRPVARDGVCETHLQPVG
jgi:hypothetical protein